MFSLVALLATVYVDATIILQYAKGTGGPTGVGRNETTCTPTNCKTTSSCTEGTGICLDEAGFNNACPTYESVSAACPGAARVWLNNPVNTAVANIWSQIEADVNSGSQTQTFVNTETSEVVVLLFTWAPQTPGSSIILITISEL